MEWWGPIIYEYYSSTEGAGGTFIEPEEWLAHPGTVGKPMAGAVHVLDDDGNELPIGEPGTLWFEGELGFEYRNDPVKTAEAVNALGYKTVGDIGYVDEAGYVYLTDRKALMIISGGVNIYPQEAENVLVMHPKVTDVAVFGVPDDDLGEQVKAVVQPDVWPPDEIVSTTGSQQTVPVPVWRASSALLDSRSSGGSTYGAEKSGQRATTRPLSRRDREQRMTDPLVSLDLARQHRADRAGGPPVNALNEQVREQLVACCPGGSAADDVRAVVVAGAGGRLCCKNDVTELESSAWPKSAAAVRPASVQPGRRYDHRKTHHCSINGWHGVVAWR